MEVEKPPLPLGESANVDDALRLDSRLLERRLVGHGRDDEFTRALEADKSRVEQVIDAWHQQQSILPIEPFVVRRIPPGLAVACNEVRYDTLTHTQTVE